MKTGLKLYIWTEFQPNWNGGLAFAIATDEADARKQIEVQWGLGVDDWGDLEIKPLSKRIARCVSGGA